MTGFSLPENYTDNPERLVRRARPRVIPPLAILPAQEPILEAPLVLEAMAEKTLREFSVLVSRGVSLRRSGVEELPQVGFLRQRVF